MTANNHHDPEAVTRMLRELPDLCAMLLLGDINRPDSGRPAPRDPARRSPIPWARWDALNTSSKGELVNHIDHIGDSHGDGRGESRLGILPALDSWAVLLEADMLDRSPDLPAELPAPTIAGVCDWLVRHLRWWVDQPQWDEFAPDVALQWRRARQLTGIRDPMRLACPLCRAPMRVQDGEEWTLCDNGHQHDGPNRLARQWRRKPSMSTQAVCEALRLPEGTLRSWKARGRIEPIRTDGAGVHYWLPWDVVLLMHPELAKSDTPSGVTVG